MTRPENVGPYYVDQQLTSCVIEGNLHDCMTYTKTAHTVIRLDDEENNYLKHVQEFIKINSNSASRWFYYIFQNIILAKSKKLI